MSTLSKSNFKKHLLNGTAVVAVAAALAVVSFSGSAMAAEKTTGGAESLTASGTWVGGAAPVTATDSIKWGGNHTVTANADFTFASTTGTSAGNSFDTVGTTAVLTMTAAKTLTLTGGIASTAGTLTINMGGTTAQTDALVINGDSVSSQTAILVNTATDATRIASITLGDGTGTTTMNGTMDLAKVAAGKAILNLNGAVVAGAVSDTNASGAIVVNVTGNSTISGAWDTATTNAGNTVTITDGKTLTLSNTFTVGAAGKIVVGTSTAGGTLALTGAGKTITGLIDANTATTGTLALSGTGTTTVASNVGASKSLASITLAAGTKAAFSGTVAATTITVSNVNANTFAKTVTGNLNFAADGTATMANAALLDGNVDNTTGADGAGTFTIADQTSAIVGVSGTVGATNTLKAVNVTINTSDVTFNQAVRATTITVTGDTSSDVAAFKGDITGAVVISGKGLLTLTADKKIMGSITTGTDGQGNLTFATATADTVLVSGAVGGSGKALLAMTVNTGAGVTSTFGSTIDARTVTLAGTGTTAFADDVTAVTSVNFTGDGVASFAANKKIVGNVDAGANEGTVNFTATSTDTTLVSGTVGATNAIKVLNVAPASGVTATFAGAYTVTTTTHSGLGTVAFSDNVTGDVNLAADGTVTVAVGKIIDGNVDNTTSADGAGTLSIGASGTATVVSGTVGATNSLKSVTLDSTGGIGTFAGAVKATTVNLAGTGTAAFSGDVTGVVNFTAVGKSTVAANKKIIGSMTTSATGQGEVTFAPTTTDTTVISEDVGTSAATLLSVTAGAAPAKTATFGGNVYADTLNLSNTGASGVVAIPGDITAKTLFTFTADGTLALNGTSAQTVTGDLTTGTGGQGQITVSNTGGLVKFASLVGVSSTGVGDVTLNTGSKTQFDKAVFAKTITLTTTADLTVDATVTTTGTLTTGNGNVVTLGSAMINGTTVFKAADSTGTLDQTAGAVTVNPNAAFTSGTVTLLQNAAVAMDTTDLASFTVTDNALFNYTLALANTSKDIAITVVKKSAATTATELGVTNNEAVALGNANTAVATGDASALAAMTAVLTAGGTSAKKAAEQVGVQADTLGAGTATSISTGGTIFGIASNRLSAMRTGNQYASIKEKSGFSSGGAALNKAGWLKVFGNRSTQDTKDAIKGFSSDTYGTAVGVDSLVTDNSRLGASFSYAKTNVDGKGAGQSSTDTKSYQLTVYGDYTANSFYVNGMVGVAANKNDTSRVINFGGLNRTAKGSYDSRQYMVSVSGGLPMEISQSTYFTPTAGVAWTHVSSDNYTETGAGGLNLKVNPDSVDAAITSLGGQLRTKIKAGRGFFVPELRAGLSYDLAGDEATATGQYTGGGAAFKTTGAKVEKLGENVGLGFTYEDGAWSVSANYDGSFKSGFRSHSGSLEARVKF